MIGAIAGGMIMPDYNCRVCQTAYSSVFDKDRCEKSHGRQLNINEYTTDMFAEAFNNVSQITGEENRIAWEDDTMVAKNHRIILYKEKSVYKLPTEYDVYKITHIHPALDTNIEPIWVSPDNIDITFLNRMLKNMHETIWDRAFKRNDKR